MLSGSGAVEETLKRSILCFQGVGLLGHFFRHVLFKVRQFCFENAIGQGQYLYGKNTGISGP